VNLLQNLKCSTSVPQQYGKFTLTSINVQVQYAEFEVRICYWQSRT